MAKMVNQICIAGVVQGIAEGLHFAKRADLDVPKVIEAIAEARAHGDLKENAEYHAAREEQGFIEARIKDIEGKLSHKQIIDASAVDARGKVIFGSTVVILDEKTDKETTYKIVGEDEADIKQRRMG